MEDDDDGNLCNDYPSTYLGINLALLFYCCDIGWLVSRRQRREDSYETLVCNGGHKKKCINGKFPLMALIFHLEIKICFWLLMA